jgi:hypothetical protein
MFWLGQLGVYRLILFLSVHPPVPMKSAIATTGYQNKGASVLTSIAPDSTAIPASIIAVIAAPCLAMKAFRRACVRYYCLTVTWMYHSVVFTIDHIFHEMSSDTSIRDH